MEPESWCYWLLKCHPILSPPASQKDVQELILNPRIPSLTLPLKNSSPKAIMECETFEHELPVFLTESQQWIWRGRRCGIGNKQKKAWKRDPECYFWNWVTWDKYPPSISSELYSLELCFPTFKLWIKKVTILNVVKKVCVYTKSGSLPERARDTFKKRNIKIMKQIKIKINNLLN